MSAMRVLIVSPIGVTRRVLENWLTPLGHKVLSADTFDSASRLLSSNPGIELVITEWLLGGQNAFDILKKTQQITHVSDAAETSSTIKLIVMTTPGWENARLVFQMDALKASDSVVFIEKPINRELVLGTYAKMFPSATENRPAPVGMAKLSTVSPTGSPTPSIESREAELLRQTVNAQKETLEFLAKLHADAQERLQPHLDAE
jgi:DNA-binding NtrC family response regulator